ncbi:hypothetical protein MKX01_014761 [Papaver californicum]|nr:hypothetical protein MKX01_014761 [Papaver californicum]
MLIIHMPKGIIKCRTNFLLDISIGASSRILCNQILCTYCGSDGTEVQIRQFTSISKQRTSTRWLEFIGAGKSKIFSEEVDECILWLSIIFITILCTPQPTVVRWSATPPISYEILLRWKGFCALIANAYYIKGMAWLPVKTLQLEQMAVVGYSEEPSLVASRMQLLFSTPEGQAVEGSIQVVSPQWPII